MRSHAWNDDIIAFGNREQCRYDQLEVMAYETYGS